jgi:hypothetical protein
VVSVISLRQKSLFIEMGIVIPGFVGVKKRTVPPRPTDSKVWIMVDMTPVHTITRSARRP